MSSSNSLGILIGLALGKPIGIGLSCFAAVKAGLCRLPKGLRWGHVAGAGLPGLVDASKMAILIASLLSGVAGFCWLKLCCKPPGPDASAWYRQSLRF